jgi:peptide/nickel transport system ATP-binding protein/oligopeptide transport system ATP-binding protein
LEVKDLKTYFNTEAGVVRAVNEVNFHVNNKETLGIVGESGCGKSVTALSILRLILTPPGKIVGGSLLFKNNDLLALSESQMRKIRGNEISMIFQEPMTSLNPVFQIGKQIEEALVIHQGLKRNDAKEKAIEMLKTVGIPSPETRIKDYPHQLSGGMRQRIMIAMAFSCNPSLLIADEPTTALDVTIQAQILYLMKEMKEKNGASIILITHDLGIVAENAQRVVVMYAGEIVEVADVRTLFSSPLHPYTIGLLESVPRKTSQSWKSAFNTIKGRVPSLMHLPRGCNFQNRCNKCGNEKCSEVKPELMQVEDEHWVRCFQYT